jgi:hypothetical protein
LQRLFRELGIAQGIASALEAHDEAIAYELIVSNTLNRSNILDAGGRMGGIDKK